MEFIAKVNFEINSFGESESTFSVLQCVVYSGKESEMSMGEMILFNILTSPITENIDKTKI